MKHQRSAFLAFTARVFLVLLVAAETLSGCGGTEAPLGDGAPEDGAPSDTAPSDTRPPSDLTPDTSTPLSPLAALPAEAPGATARFATKDECALCHSAEMGALEDDAGRGVSMDTLFRTSMKAFSARDPYYLAVFSHELALHPQGQEAIEDVCTRCHAPAAAQELNRAGSHVSFEALTSESSAIMNVGRDGVTCTVCHQIQPEGLGTELTFTGNFTVGDERRIFGPHAEPFEMPMVMHSGYTPVHEDHVSESSLCATCHTVLTRAIDDEGAFTGPVFAEQAPFLEWRSSSFDAARGGAEAATCQDCHLPTTDEDGRAIRAAISNRPRWLDVRAPVGRHVFVGANAYMLELLADNREWAGIAVPEAEIRQSAARSSENLRTAASLSIEDVGVRDGELRADVRVRNLTGHKLPTAYPTRRVWLHFEVLGPDDAVLWSSGAVDGRGVLVDGSGAPLESRAALLPHRDEVSRQDQVQVYESVMGDAAGGVTAVLLDATRYVKDNRLLPAGWYPSAADADLIAAIGTSEDSDFVAGEDVVTYRALVSGAARLRVRLLYQSIPPLHLDVLRDHPTPATMRLAEMMDARPPLPRLIASAERSL